MKRTADVIMQDLEIFSRLRRNCAELFPAVSVEEMPGGAAYVGVMSSINTDFNVSSEKTFDISTDTSTKTITVVYYSDPSKQSIAKKVNNVFTKAKDAENKALFSLSDCKVIQETTLKLYKDNSKGII